MTAKLPDTESVFSWQDAVAIDVSSANVTANAASGFSNGFIRGIYVGTTGDVKIQTNNGNDVVFPSVPAGVVLPIIAKVVYNTGTTASGLVGGV